MDELSISYDESLDKIEAMMEEIGTIEFETSGFFCGGMYVKSIVIPAGSYLTSLVHKKEHPFILSQGNMIIYTQDGEVEIQAPYIDITKEGTRRFAKAITDCLWTCIHRTDATTDEEVEMEVVEPRKNKLLINKEEVKCHLQQ